MAPHLPYDPPPEFAARFATDYAGPVQGSRDALTAITLERRDISDDALRHVISLYDGEIASVDAEVSRLLRGLRETGLAEGTLVVLTADHGEELFERNHYFAHACSIYPSVLEVPWVLRLPGELPAGHRVSTLVETIDIAPTILELLQLERPAAFAGRSQAARARGDELSTPGRAPAAFAELDDRMAAIQTDRWFYVDNPDGRVPRCGPFVKFEGPNAPRYRIGRRELYDRSIDPGAQHEVADEHDASALALKARLEEWGGGPNTPASTPVIDVETREALRALGYAD